MKRPSIVEPELSRPLFVDKISAGGVLEHVVARPAERMALARRFDLLDLPKLEADLNVDLTSNGKMIAVTGKMSARVVQACVLTLEPVESGIEDDIDILYAPASFLDAGAGPPHAGSGDDEAPEPIVDGIIDLGELVVQHLAVAINPYPRKEGVVLGNAGAEGPSSAGSFHNPFAKLAEFKRKNKP